MKIAILEDDPTQLQMLVHVMHSLGHETSTYTNGKPLMEDLAADARFDLLIIDWQLPDVTGLQVIDWVRRHLLSQVPTLFVTSRADEEDVVAALAAGADDYMVKPVGQSELKARILALLRRSFPEAMGPLAVGDYVFDPASKTVFLRGEKVDIPPREFELAFFMFRQAGRLVSRRRLQEAVWKSSGETASRSVDTYVSRIRTRLKLGQDNGYRLCSVYRQGYRLEAVSARTGAVEVLA